MDSTTVKDALSAMQVEACIAKTETLRACIGDLPLNALEKVIRYGFKRHLNDGNGGKETPPETKVALAQAKLARLLAGDVVRHTRAAMSDKDRFVTNFVMQTVRKAMRDAGKDTSGLPTRARDRFTFATNVLERNPALAKRAEKAWADSQAGSDIDLAGLGL